MRIPDEKQLFNIGDRVLVENDLSGIVDAIEMSSVYYDHRPIATFIQYTYVVLIGEKKLYLKADQLTK